MSTTTIAADQDVATLINVFAVTRENQQPLATAEPRLYEVTSVHHA